MSGEILLILCIIRIYAFNTNKLDSDQTPRSVSSDLGLHCLLMYLLWDSSLEETQQKLEK